MSPTKKEPNVWIKFTQRVSNVLKDANIHTGRPNVSKQFAASLIKKEKKYDWTDDEILSEWFIWEGSIFNDEQNKKNKEKRKRNQTNKERYAKVKTGNLLGLKNKRNDPNLLSFEPTEEGMKSRGNELEGLFGGKRRTRKRKV